jgi:hypothetical protein
MTDEFFIFARIFSEFLDPPQIIFCGGRILYLQRIRWLYRVVYYCIASCVIPQAYRKQFLKIGEKSEASLKMEVAD